MEAWLGTQYWLGVTVIITEQIVSRLSGGIRLAYAAYEGEGTQESVKVGQRKESWPISGPVDGNGGYRESSAAVRVRVQTRI